MVRDERIKFFAEADYTEGSELDKLIKTIIDRTERNERLERTYYSCLDEVRKNDLGKAEEDRKRTDLILALEDSRSFAQTHNVVKQMDGISNWTDNEVESIVDIALKNSQVYYILNDTDVKKFFLTLTKGRKTKNIEKLRNALE
jgi:hypothetical protein